MNKKESEEGIVAAFYRIAGSIARSILIAMLIVAVLLCGLYGYSEYQEKRFCENYPTSCINGEMNVAVAAPIPKIIKLDQETINAINARNEIRDCIQMIEKKDCLETKNITLLYGNETIITTECLKVKK